MRHRSVALLAVLVAALTITGSALAFDCIRVSSSLQGLTQSTKSGHWLLFDFSSASGVERTFEIFEVPVTSEQARCIATAYAETGQPLYFALGIGVAGGQNPNAAAGGVIAHNNPNERVLSNGKGIDHFDDSGIIPALIEAATGCGLAVA